MTDLERDAIERLLDGEAAGPGGPLSPPSFEPKRGAREVWIEEALDRAAGSGPAGTVAKPEGRRALPWIGLAVGVAAAVALVLALVSKGKEPRSSDHPAAMSERVPQAARITAPVREEAPAPDMKAVTDAPDASPSVVEVARVEAADRRDPGRVMGSAPPPSIGSYLNVQTKPWSKVYVDGKFVHNTPMIHHQLAPGYHRITLRRDDLRIRRSYRFLIEAGMTTTIVKTLDHPEPDSRHIVTSAEQGTLSVQTRPWSEVWVDGEFVRRTPLVDYHLPAGYHMVIIRRQEYSIEKTFRVRVLPGQNTALVRTAL